MSKIFTSSSLTARYISLKHPEIKHVYLIGQRGVREELKNVGISCAGVEDDKKSMKPEDFPFETDPNIKGVVVGWDWDFNYYKLTYASLCLQRGAIFFATNNDGFDTKHGLRLPGGGSMVQCLVKASGDSSPLIIGKPNVKVIETIEETFKIDRKRTMIIGDRMDSDIMLGNNAGISSLLVLTGCTRREELEKVLGSSSPENDLMTPEFLMQELDLAL